MQIAGAKVQNISHSKPIIMKYFVFLHPILTIYMKFLLKYSGLALIFLGVLLLVVLHMLNFTFVNFITFTPFAIIIIGVFLHVWVKKQESKY